ncbi:uncharacterized protein LOC114946727 isoform X3 [Nylanderia fulva]|nr:uncharacterized protein LOC114932900 isoform X2 [Nylanderia fulva]XP_029164762.1 uncharacterized protein LOC114935975 isoform X3 [Nylanderia fulva]XP_029169442.1 uncharacterized protein LOC114939345 isoform X3 [Nylanderia fulva]XP_029179209.1 uncharacterized protein LOC114946727 isoform X3 [Nylanderia fulva]
MSKRTVYSDLEKQVFLEILKKYKHIVESKGTNTSTLKEKSEAWSIIMEEYNNSSLISTKRDVQQLRKYWSNLKQQNKNILTTERQSRFLTGGGPQKNIAEVDPNVLDIVPDLMTTAPTISSSNFSKAEYEDRQIKVLKAIQQNASTKIDYIASGECLKTQKLLTSNEPAFNIDDMEFEMDDTIYDTIDKESNNESEKENSILSDRELKRNKNRNATSRSNSKKQKTERMTIICDKEMELADIKINHEIEICKLKKEREQFINKMTIKKLFLEKKELQERAKLAKFRAQREMGEHYISDDE